MAWDPREPRESVLRDTMARLGVGVGVAFVLAAVSGPAAAKVTVDEEGVMHQRGDAQPPAEFDLDKLEAVHSGTHDQLDAPGIGTSYRIHYEYQG